MASNEWIKVLVICLLFYLFFVLTTEQENKIQLKICKVNYVNVNVDWENLKYPVNIWKAKK